MKCPVFSPSGALREIIRNFQKVCKDFSHAFLASCPHFSHADWLEMQDLMAKQTKITIETDSLLILRGRNSTRAWCPRCAAESEMIAPENLGVISNLEQPALEKWLTSEELHRLQAADGSALICLNSLLARVQNTKTR
jgi:hypothetical protein